MNPVTAYPMAHALGWTLLHFCWEGAAVALLLWGVLGAAGASSRLRYAVSCIALGLLIALPLATFVRLAAQDYRLAALARAPIPAADIFVTAASAGATSPWPARLSVALDHAMPLLLSAWCIGVLCLFGRLSLGLLAAHHLRARGTAVSADLQKLFANLCARIGIERVVRLVNCAQVEVPIVVGWLRPAVLLPVSCLSGLAPDQIEAILCHELAHVRRHDYLVSVLQSIVETLLFYHPAVWWVSKQIRRERECCCDEFAVSVGGDVLAYARALSFLEEQRTLTPRLALGANGGVLKMRIQRLLGRPETSATSQIASIALLTIVALSALTVAARHVWAEASVSHPSASTSPSNLTADSSAKPAGDSAGLASREMNAELDRIRNVQNQQSGLQGQLEEIKDGQAKYTALLAQAGQQAQISDEDRSRLEDAARNLTNSIEAWVDQFNREIDARNAAIDRFNSPDFQKRMADAVARINSTDLRQQLADVQAAIAKMKADDLPRQIAATEALRRQLNSAEMQAKINAAKAAMSQQEASRLQKQAEASRAAIDKMNSPELRARVDEMAKEYARLASEQNRKRVEDAVRAMQMNQAELDARMKAMRQQSQLYARNEAPSATEVPSPQQPNTAGPVRVSSGVMANLVVNQPNPVYPPIAKAAHVQGVVVLHAIISREGAVEKLTVISGPPMLVQSAVDAVQKWTYQPFMLNGQPVEVETTINVNYTFGGDDTDAAPSDQDGAATSMLSSPATDEAGNIVRRIGAGVSAPLVIHQVEPEFSDEAKVRVKAQGKDGKFDGTVMVQLIVDSNGRPQNVHVVRGIGMGLDQKAVEAIQQYRFKPAMEDGKPVPVLLNVEVNFKSF